MDTFLHKLTLKETVLTNKDRKDIEKYIVISEGIVKCLQSISELSSKKKLGQLLKKTEAFKKMSGGATPYTSNNPRLDHGMRKAIGSVILPPDITRELELPVEFDDLLQRAEENSLGVHLRDINDFIRREGEYFKSIIMNKIISNGYHELFKLAIERRDFTLQKDAVSIAIENKMYNMIVPLIEHGAKYHKKSVMKCVLNDMFASTHARDLININNSPFKIKDFLNEAILLKNFNRFLSITDILIPKNESSIFSISFTDRKKLIISAFDVGNTDVVMYLFHELKKNGEMKIIGDLLEIFNASTKEPSRIFFEWLRDENDAYNDYYNNINQPPNKSRRLDSLQS